MKKILLSLFLFSASGAIYSQTYKEVMSPTDPIHEPQTWTFMRYGNSTPKLYTGTVNIGIPIYTYSDNDFIIPVSLSYASNGYMPNNQANFVGLGWVLSAGGCITRETNGIPDLSLTFDEFPTNLFLVPPGEMGNDIYGYLKYVEYKKRYNIPEWSSANTVAYRTIMAHRLYDGKWCETSSDIYHFNFMGYNGSFVFGTDGLVHIFNTNDNSYQFDVEFTYEVRPIITIYDGRGYKYTFGDPTITNKKLHEIDNPTISQDDMIIEKQDCWLLLSIVAPNGREVVFHYGNDTPDIENNGDGEDNDGELYTIESVRNLCFRARYYCTYGWNGDDFGDTNVWSYRTVPSQHRVCQTITYLRKILVDDFTIDFEYGIRQPEKYCLNGGPIVECQTPYKLNKILCYDSSDKIIKRADLIYNYTATSNTIGNPVLLLDSLKLSSEGDYAFDYYDTDKYFPFHGTTGIDHWGYYNGVDSYDVVNLMPAVILDTLNVQHIMSTNRTPNASKAIYGMLHRVTYPTHGKTEFFYEAHTYNKKVTRDDTSLNMPYLKYESNSQEAGGLRLCEVNSYDKNDLLCTHLRYEYKIDNISTGTLLKSPIYIVQNIMKRREDLSQAYQYVDISTANTWYALYNNSSHIGYDAVKTKYSNNSYDINYFSSYSLLPDSLCYAGQADSIFIDSDVQIIRPRVGAINFWREPRTLHTQRGKLIKTERYMTSGEKSSVTEHLYDYDKKNLYWIKSFDLSTGFDYYLWILADDFPLIGNRHIKYFGKDSLITTESYAYNSKRQLIKTTIESSNGDLLKKQVYYPYNPYHSDAIIDSMKSKNILDRPLVTSTTVTTQGGRPRITNFKRYSYVVSYNTIKLREIENAKLSMGTSSSFDLEYSTEIIYDKYDSHGNVREIIDKNGMHTCYIWGYGGLYPVAKIENATMNQLIQLTHVNSISNYFTGWNGLSATQDTLLRTLPNARVTTYYYEPFVGLTQVIDPSGKQTSYEYNSNGKLKAVKDNDGNLLNSYDYSIE